jgi:hypothetical protein
MSAANNNRFNHANYFKLQGNLSVWTMVCLIETN